MAEKLQIQIEVDGSNATATINGVTKSFKDMGDESESSGKKTSNSLQSIGVEALKAYAAFEGLTRVMSSSISAANDYNAALMGLASVSRYAGQDMGATMSAAAKLTEDGLLSTTEAATALKNLMSRGFSTAEAVQMIERFKDSAAFGRQSALQLGEAVVGATEGIKNENSMLVDNAGVTKNVAKMWDEYAKSIGTTANNLTTAQKRSAELNGVMQETEAQVGNAALAANSFTGETAKMNKAITDAEVAFGQALAPAATGAAQAVTFLLNEGIKPTIFFLQSLGVGMGEFMQKAGIVAEFVSTPSKWFNPGAAAKWRDDLEKQWSAAGDLAESERMRIIGAMTEIQTPDIGKDSGARRTETTDTGPDKTAIAAQKRIDAAVQREGDKFSKLISMQEQADAKGAELAAIKLNQDLAAMDQDRARAIEAKSWTAALEEQFQQAQAGRIRIATEDITKIMEDEERKRAEIIGGIEQARIDRSIASLSAQSGFEMAMIEQDRQRKQDAGTWTLQQEADFQTMKADLQIAFDEEQTQLQSARETAKLERDLAAFDAKMQRMIDEYLMTAELQAALDEERIAIVQATADRILAIEDEAALRRGQAETTAQRAKLAAMTEGDRFSKAVREGDLSSALEHGAKMTSGLAKQNRAMFEINKAAALANAVVSLPSAVMKSFENGGGYPWGLIPAGLMLAEGMAQISAISSASFGGGGGGGASVGGGGGGGGGMGANTPTGGVSAAPGPLGAQQPAQNQAASLTINVSAPQGLVDPIAAQQLADSLAPHLNDALRRGLNTSTVV